MKPSQLQRCMQTRIPTSTLIGVCLLMAVTMTFAAGAPMDILNARNPRVQAVMAVQDEWTPALLRLPGVVGTATGVNADGEVAIKVYLESAGAVGLPPFLSGVPVDIEVSGMFTARAENLTTTDQWQRPVPIGVSTGHPQITAGTIGARVKDAAGNRFALSNNHVYANNNAGKIGDSQVLYDGDIVLQPGTYDGGSIANGDGIGWLYAFKPLLFNGSINYIDAAIAYVPLDKTIGTVGNYLVDVSTPDRGYGTPSSTITPVDELVVGVVNNKGETEPNESTKATKVLKYGRTTGQTTGWVDAINWHGYVCYETRGARCSKQAYFKEQILIWPGTFSAGGDSGSLIVTEAGNHPVALLFAGGSVHTIASPIEFVLDAFNVSIDGIETPNTAPSVSINTPGNGSSFKYGESIKFSGYASDLEDDALTELSWASNIDGPIGSGGSFSEALSSGTHTITASVTDSGGLTGTDTVTITVNEGTAPVIQ
jgi:hypothetical protein